MKNKKLISTLLIGVLCFSSGLMANTLVKQIKVNQHMDIEVTKGYQKQILNDAKGKRIYPLMYDGTIYLPIRAVGNITNSDITWDGTNKRINVDPKVNVQYVQVPSTCNHETNNSNTNDKEPSYNKLSSSDKRKIDDYEEKIKTYEKKLSSLDDDLEDLYDDEDYYDEKYDKTGQQSYKEKLTKIREDISDCKDDIKELKSDIKAYKTKIDDIYKKYK